MGAVDEGIPERLAQVAREQFGIGAFVETGTFRGNTTAFAAVAFPRVFTVDIDRGMVEAARRRFAGQRHVECLEGNSPDGLRAILPKLGAGGGDGESAMFWLDAHSSEVCDCPLMEELALINAWDESGERAFVLVDDARYFLAPPPPPHKVEDWPGLAEVTAALSYGGKRYVAAVEDVLVAFPMRAKRLLVQYAQSRPLAWVARAGGGVYFVGRSPGGGK